MQTILNFLKLIRIWNLLFTFVAVLTGGWIVAPGEISLTLILGGISALLVALGSNIYNDLQDRISDQINRPDRILLSGRISDKFAKVVLWISLLFGCAIGWLLPPETRLIPLVVTILLLWYNRQLKRTAGWGNLVVAICGSGAPLLGGMIVGYQSKLILPVVLTFTGFLLREIVKDVADVAGDKVAGYQTLPIRVPFRYVIAGVIGLICCIGLEIALLIYSSFYHGVLFSIGIIMIIGLAAVIIYFTGSWTIEDVSRSKRISMLSKLILLLGMLSLVSGRSGV